MIEYGGISLERQISDGIIEVSWEKRNRKREGEGERKVRRGEKLRTSRSLSSIHVTYHIIHRINQEKRARMDCIDSMINNLLETNRFPWNLIPLWYSMNSPNSIQSYLWWTRLRYSSSLSWLLLKSIFYLGSSPFVSVIGNEVLPINCFRCFLDRGRSHYRRLDSPYIEFWKRKMVF